MAMQVFANGTYTPTTVPETVYVATGTANNTQVGVYQFFLDTSTLSYGESVSIQLLEKVLPTSVNQQIVFESVVSGPQTQPLWVSPSILLMHAWTFQIMQSAGSIIRSFEWSIRSIS
jgi:hypothetical protein